MSGVDVRDLANEKLAAGKFPVEPRADFRLYIAPEVRRGIEEHAKADVTVEICGVLVGNWGTDENGPYAAVTDYIRCANATSKFAEVTFTHESWAQINKEMDSRFTDARIIGWYHSHPDFGIFLSERDAFIQEHFFSGPGQVAYVVDPVRDLEGVFAWRNGKPTPMPHYWIGNRVRTVEATERSGAGTSSKPPAGAGGHMNGVERASSDGSMLGLATMVLGGLCLLMLGNLYGGWRARAAENYMRQETVAGFANSDLYRVQLEIELESVRKRLFAVSDAMSKLPQPGAKLSKKELEEAAIRGDAIQKHLKEAREELSRAERISDAERELYTRMITLKMSELQRILEAAAAAQQKAMAARKAAPGNGAAGGDSQSPAKKSEVPVGAHPVDQASPTQIPEAATPK